MQLAFSTSRTSAPRIVSWSPPLDGGVKLNSDGNSQGNIGLSGFGGLLRDSFGIRIHGYSGFCGYTSILNEELLGILYGMKLA